MPKPWSDWYRHTFLKIKELPKRQNARRMKKSHKKSILEFMCCVPALILILILYYYPIIELFRISFTDWNLIKKDYQYVGLTNWKWLVENISRNHVLESFVTTLKYTVGHLSVILIGGILLALLFNRKNKGFAVMRSVIFLPYYIAMSSVALVFLVILNENYGIANCIMELLGFDRVGWLTQSVPAMLMLIVMTSWKAIGYDMMIFMSAINGISKTYYEAAMIDGATQKDIFFKITMPMLSPTFVFLLVTQFLSSMKVYAAADVLTEGGPYRATQVMVYLIYDMAFEDFRIDRAAVVSILFFICLMFVTALMMHVSKKRTNYDA